MKYYRIVFAKNEVISCSEAKDIEKIENQIEQQNGQLIFALVKASNEQEATTLGKSLAAQVTGTHDKSDT